MKLRTMLFSGVALVVAMQGTSALAQAASGTTVGEVVVTARRVEENLQSIPVSVSVANGERLEQANISDIRDLQTITPGLAISNPVGDPTGGVIAIRGQFQADTLLTTDGSTGVYVDGAYIPRGSGLRSILGNTDEIERVEVLRGPQGTLFGRNTTGGALNIVTKAPNADFGGYVGGSGASHGFYEVLGGLNIPLGEGAGLRISAQHSESDGYGKDGLGRALHATETDYFHFRLRLEPSDQLVADFSGTYQNYESSGEAIKLFGLCGLPGSGCTNAIPGGNGTFAVIAGLGLPLIPANFPTGIGTFASYASGDPFSSGATQNGPNSAEVLNFVGTVAYEFNDMLSAKSVSSYTKVDRTETLDLDGTPFNILTPTLPQSYEFYSQEFQLIRAGERLDYVLGVYVSREEGTDGSIQYALPAINPANPVLTDGSVVNASSAIFGQLNYQITDRLTFTGGLRYTTEDKRLVSRNHTGGVPQMGIILPVIGPPLPGQSAGVTAAGTTCAVPYVDQDSPTQCQATYDASFSDVSWLFSLDYQLNEDTLLYGKVSKGFRGGGQNLRGTANQGTFEAFEPETAIQYETGLKTTFLDQRARLNLSLWYTDYSDIQRSRIFSSPSGTGTQVSNAASAQLWGGELEGVLVPVDNLTLTTAVAYFKGEYEEWEDGDLDRSPTPFGFPEWTFYLGANYKVPLESGQLAFQVDYRWQDESVLFTENRTPGVGACCTQTINPANTLYQDAYSIWNARISLRLDRFDTELALFGRNLSDELYYNSGVDLAALGHRVVTYAEPRVIGFEVKKRF